MPMTGVMPLPALMNSILAGRGSGRVNAPSISPSRTRSPGWIRCTRCGDTTPPSTFLGVTLISPSSGAGSDVSEYARQWYTPSMTTPSRTY